VALGGKLPQRRAYAAGVSIADGMLVIGGENAETIFQDTLMLRWDGNAVVIERGPALPAPRTSQVAAVLGGSVYVAGGYAPGAVRVSSGDFWRLDLAQLTAGWKKLATWPGPTRAQGTIAALDGAIDLISGLEMGVDAEGKAKPTYLGDAYRYRAEKWERLPDMPWTAIAAPFPAPVSEDLARIWVLGGVDSRLVGKVPRDTRVPDHIMYFDVLAHEWKTVEERWPDPVVTAPMVQIGGESWIVSGEIMAGLRTTKCVVVETGDGKMSAVEVTPMRAWLTVALLWFVGFLNYLDRVMIHDDAAIHRGRDPDDGCAVRPADDDFSDRLWFIESVCGLPRGSVQPQSRDRDQLGGLVGDHMADGACDDLWRTARDEGTHGHQ